MAVTDPRNAMRHRRAVMARASATAGRLVMPKDWRERRALDRMTARGEAVEVLGLPGVWRVIR